MGLLYMILAAPAMVQCFFISLDNIRWGYLQIQPRDISKPAQSLEYILNIIELIENREDLQSKIKLEGLLRLHVENCQMSSLECPCTLFVPVKNIGDQEEIEEVVADDSQPLTLNNGNGK
jgi:hypothetical protein